jgi:hypothetical protein
MSSTATEVLRRANEVSDEGHAAVRTMRNALLIASFGAIILLIIVASLGALAPSLVPVCAPEVCPTGGSSPGAGDVTLVALFGCVGASLAVVQSLASMSTPETPYALNWAQMLLKVPAGALTSLVAVLALNSQVVANIVPPASHAGLLFYAIAFGYSQQAATRLVDQKAESVLNQARPS